MSIRNKICRGVQVVGLAATVAGVFMLDASKDAREQYDNHPKVVESNQIFSEITDLNTQRDEQGREILRYLESGCSINDDRFKEMTDQYQTLGTKQNALADDLHKKGAEVSEEAGVYFDDNYAYGLGATGLIPCGIGMMVFGHAFRRREEE
jgi:predicted nuclease with TOPRIM domain